MTTTPRLETDTLGLGYLTPAQITADQNNYLPTGGNRKSIWRLSSDATRNITGIVPPSEDRVLVLTNVGAFNIVLKDDSASSTNVNRIALSGDLTIGPDQGAVLVYDIAPTVANSRWRAVLPVGSAAPTGAAGGELSGTYPNPTIANDAVVFARMLNATGASVLIGRGAGAGGGDFQEITLGSGVSMTGTVLSATSGSYATTADIADVATAESAGAATTVPRGDHVHAHGTAYLPDAHHNQSHSDADHSGANKVDVDQNAALIGTRTALNFVQSTLVVDNGGAGRVDITPPACPICFQSGANLAWGPAIGATSGSPEVQNNAATNNVTVIRFDTQMFRQARLTFGVGTAWQSTGTMRPQYSTDLATWTYIESAGTGLATLADSGGFKDSGWVDVAAGMQAANTYLRIVGYYTSAPGSSTGGVRMIYLHLR